MPRVIDFDVNETLLDLTALEPVFAAAFGEVGAALAMVAERRGVPVDAATRSALGDGVRRQPPHPVVTGALDRLQRAGCRLATLTNNPLSAVEAQQSNAGLRDRFEQVLSVDAVPPLQARARTVSDDGGPARGAAD